MEKQAKPERASFVKGVLIVIAVIGIFYFAMNYQGDISESVAGKTIESPTTTLKTLFIESPIGLKVVPSILKVSTGVEYFYSLKDNGQIVDNEGNVYSQLYNVKDDYYFVDHNSVLQPYLVKDDQNLENIPELIATNDGTNDYLIDMEKSSVTMVYNQDGKAVASPARVYEGEEGQYLLQTSKGTKNLGEEYWITQYIDTFPENTVGSSIYDDKSGLTFYASKKSGIAGEIYDKDGNPYRKVGGDLYEITGADKEGNPVLGKKVKISKEARKELNQATSMDATDAQKQELAGKVSDMANSLLGEYVVSPMIAEFCKSDTESSNTDSDMPTSISTALGGQYMATPGVEGGTAEVSNPYLQMQDPNAQIQLPETAIEACIMPISIANVQVAGSAGAYQVWYTLTACSGNAVNYEIYIVSAGTNTTLGTGQLDNGKTITDTYTSSAESIEQACVKTDDSTIGSNGTYCAPA